MPMSHFDPNAPNPRLPVLQYARFIPNATREMEGANGSQSLYSCGFAGAATHCKISHFAARNTQTRPPLYRGGAAMRALTRRIDIELYHLEPEAEAAPTLDANP